MANNKLDLAKLERKLELLDMRIKALEKMPPEQLQKRLEKIEGKLYLTKEVFTLAEVAEYLGLSTSQIYKFTMKLEIPHYKPRGKMVYFDRKEIVKWMKKHHYGIAKNKKSLDSESLEEDESPNETHENEHYGEEEQH